VIPAAAVMLFNAVAAAKQAGRNVSLAVTYVQIYKEVGPGRCFSLRHRHAFCTLVS